MARGFTDAEREQIKLRATFFNNMAVATFAAGVLTPIITMAVQEATEKSVPLAAFAAIVCFALCFVLHIKAVDQLQELDS